jgi:hypothetical protein
MPCSHPSDQAAASRLTVAEVLRAALPEYAAAHRLPAHHWRILNALLACRTARLGGHVYRCLDCGEEHFVPHSCRNRHCPACQRALAENWLAAQEAQLLPVPYFHVVFTLPHLLNPLIQQNQRAFYNLLFQAASQTLLAFGEQRWHAQVGVTAVLHTWSQTLGDHYHLHCLVTGGGWDREQRRWSSSGRRYLFPVRALSAVFRGKYLAGLQRLAEEGGLEFHGKLEALGTSAHMTELLRECARQSWVVYSKRPFAGPAQVLRYLSHYTHRIAISSARLRALDHEARTVTFAYKDYADGSRTKTMTLSWTEFTRRFLLHLLPARFVKIRHTGLLGNRGRAARLAAVRATFGVAAPTLAPPDAARPDAAVPSAQFTGSSWPCPHCGSARRELLRVVRPAPRFDSS